MKNLLCMAVTVWGLVGGLQAASSAPGDLFAQGVRAYEAGDAEAALKAFRETEAKGHFSANLFFNIGNCETQIGENGLALIAFERSLLIDPQHPGATKNFKVVSEELGVPEMQWWERMAAAIANPVLAWSGLAAFWIGVFALVALVFRPKRWAKAILAAIALTWAGVAGAALYWQHSCWNGPDVGRIVAPEAPARSAPTSASPVTEQAKAGVRVTVLATREGWVYASLQDGRRVWFAADQIERVRF